MHAIVNRLRIGTPVPAEVWERAQVEVPEQARKVPGFRSLHVIEISPEEVILVVIGDSPETLDRLATEVGNTWMRDNIGPHLAAPPDRRLGRVVASSDSM
jgi:hypothetical protein